MADQSNITTDEQLPTDAYRAIRIQQERINEENETEYLIKWTHRTEPTWEPEENITYNKHSNLLKDWRIRKRKQRKRRRINRLSLDT